jgi:hypothetical protein
MPSRFAQWKDQSVGSGFDVRRSARQVHDAAVGNLEPTNGFGSNKRSATYVPSIADLRDDRVAALTDAPGQMLLRDGQDLPDRRPSGNAIVTSDTGRPVSSSTSIFRVPVSVFAVASTEVSCRVTRSRSVRT